MDKIKFSREFSVSLLEREPKMRFKKGEDFSVWQKQSRQKLWELLGLDEMLVCDDDDFEVEGTKECSEFKTVDFTFQSETGYYVPCSVYTPNKNGNGRAVICVQGHSTGKHNSIGELIYQRDREVVGRDNDFARRALKEGYTAICIEQRYMGQCGRSEYGYPACSVSGASLPTLLLGRCAIGERVWDIMRLIDVIEKHFPEINTQNLICLGNSGGGTATFYAACIDERIKCAVPSCAVCTFKGSIGEIHHCACNYIPSIAKFFDMGDMGALIAPRTLIVVNGKQDDIFPDSEVRKCFDLIKEGYKNAGVADRCCLVTGEEGHRFYADAAWKEISNRI